MYGFGWLRGLMVTLRNMLESVFDDLIWWSKRYISADPAIFNARQGIGAKGVFTVQYPEEKLAVPERFRYLPFLVVNNYDGDEDPGALWCTACGICAQVCPPQCIWIERATDPETGRPLRHPAAFTIDSDVCMNCGFCAEFCPFDAIKMDHDYELASYDRTSAHIFDLPKLKKEIRYWETIAPEQAAAERDARRAKRT